MNDYEDIFELKEICRKTYENDMLSHDNKMNILKEIKVSLLGFQFCKNGECGCPFSFLFGSEYSAAYIEKRTKYACRYNNMVNISINDRDITRERFTSYCIINELELYIEGLIEDLSMKNKEDTNVSLKKNRTYRRTWFVERR